MLARHRPPEPSKVFLRTTPSAVPIALQAVGMGRALSMLNPLMHTVTRLCINGHEKLLNTNVAYLFETTPRTGQDSEFAGLAMERFFVGLVRVDDTDYIEVRNGDGFLHLINRAVLTRVTALGRSLLRPDSASQATGARLDRRLPWRAQVDASSRTPLLLIP
jgi:hypothetical protein